MWWQFSVYITQINNQTKGKDRQTDKTYVYVASYVCMYIVKRRLSEFIRYGCVYVQEEK